MHAVKQRNRVASLTIEQSAKQGIFDISDIYSFGSPPRRFYARLKSLDSKLQKVSNAEVLSMIDDNRLIQGIKARLISSEVEKKRERIGSVQDLVKTFESAQFGLTMDSLRFRLGQFTLTELWEKLRKRREVDESLDSWERKISHWDTFRGILLPKHSKKLSKHSIGKMFFSVLSERDENCIESIGTNTSSLEDVDIEKKPSSETTLNQKPDDGKPNDDDDKLMGVLDEVHILNQRLLNVRTDMEELRRRATKVHASLQECAK